MPFRGSLAVGLGLLTADQLRGPNFVHLHRDVYVGADTEIDTRVRVQALHAWSRERGIVAGPLAALAYGADCPWDDAEVVLPQHCRLAPDDIATRTDHLPSDEVVERHGCPITSPARTAFDLARRVPLVEAVAAVDAVAHRCHLTSEHLRRIAAAHPRARGTVQVRRVLELTDPRAESLPETRLRLGLLDRGVPPAVPQYRVVLLGGKRVRLDLAWPHVKVALEYDGPEHRTIAGQNRDAFRDGDLGDLGWDITRVTSAMLLDAAAFDQLAARVMRKLA
ncbi:type IV toxin-antitoxin system AbiEi family antitoxin [Actinomycetospora endophytica]|uniref:type IV toxin-antitoxin system AbiEi family antitoxin n=1 Tax=Actinomycetospora endophytica TaxID=2291215 RepID=UPI001E474D7C|nr:type IV toxin-antitoxin system AbiEi family antitoxin [Actinomycetospora endophytica]